MRDSRLTRLVAKAGVALGVAIGLQSVALGQASTRPGGSAPPSGGVVSGPTNADYGFPSPTAKPTNTMWNPFAQAANAIQGVFRPQKAQYRTAMAPGDPTSLKTDIPLLTAEVHIQAARLAFSRGRLAEAKSNYEKVLASDSKHLESLISLARIADSETGFEAARPFYIAALNAYPTRAAVHNDFGMSAARHQQLDIALLAFGESVRLEPKNVRYRNNAAKAYLQAGKWREALEQLVAAHPPAAAHYNYAFLVDSLGGPNEQILFHARQALRFDPNFTAARQLANTVSQRQLALQVQTRPQGRAFLPSNSTPVSANNNARTAPPATDYRQSRRMPPVNDSLFPQQGPGARKPVYLPPTAPTWPRR